MEKHQEAIIIKAQEGEIQSIKNEQFNFKLSSEQTNGLFSLIERVIAPNFVSPPQFHAHTDTDWMAYVLEGQLNFTFNDKKHSCGPGDIAYIPRMTYFRWENPSDEKARALILYTPGGFENFFKEAIGSVQKKAEQIHEYDKTLSPILAIQDKYGMIRK